MKGARRRAVDRIVFDAALVSRLLAAQFSRWAQLPIQEVADSGWDNRTFRLGSDMLVRLPSAEHYAAQVLKEQRWLPRLAQHLPLPIPTPLALGEPGADLPWHWSIYRWLDGATAARQRVDHLPRFARDLTNFLHAMWRIAADGAPSPGAHNFHRGDDLAVYDNEARSAIAALGRTIDGSAAVDAWGAALGSRWRGPPVWVHGDIAPGNLLVRGGTLSGVIDFGNCAVGDPACDLAIAWSFFDQPARRAFRARLQVGDDLWLRAAGWALWKALIVMARSPSESEGHASRQTIEAVLADVNC